MKSPPRKKNQNNGFVVAATISQNFVKAAINLRESLFDYWPDAKISLYTEQKFIDQFGSDLDTFDQVVPVGSSDREKMWAMWQSPYDRTMYIDADCEINHQDITTLFDYLDDGSDMYYVELTDAASKPFVMHRWGKGDLDRLTHCGGVCLYNSSKPLVKEFMKDWYDIYHKMMDKKWGPKQLPDVPDKYFQWDQIVLYYLIYRDPKYQSLKWKFFPDNYRWNYYSSFGNCLFREDGMWKHVDKAPVIMHYSSTMDKYGGKGILI